MSHSANITKKRKKHKISEKNLRESHTTAGHMMRKGRKHTALPLKSSEQK